jgi:enamine deaminase RidA (YjgF/YER057c/UK114 family)
MKREDFWYNAGAQSVGSIPTGTRAGQFLFLSAQTPINLDTGQVTQSLRDLSPEDRDQLATEFEFVNLHTGPIRAQTLTVYQNLSKILQQQGSSLENIIQQRIFLPDLRDTSAMEDVMLSFFPGDKPTTLILGVPNRGLHYGIRLWVDVIALIPQKGGLQKEAICLPELEPISRPYPQAVKVGQFLFMQGIMGLDPETGEPVTRLDDLGDDSARISVGQLHGDATSEAIKAQFWLIHKHMQRVLESQGAGIKDLLKLNAYWRHGMKELSNRYPLQVELFGRAESAPPLSSLISHNLSVIPQLEVVSGAMAVLPGKVHKKTGMIPNWCEGVFAEWTKAEPFWNVAGKIGYDTVKRQSVISFADITDHGRFLSQSRIDDSQVTMAKLWYIYQTLRRQTQEAKTNLLNTVQQTVFLVNPSEWPAVERMANLVFEGRIPPTTIIPCDQLAYHFRQDLPPHLPPHERVGEFRITETAEIDPICIIS